MTTTTTNETVLAYAAAYAEMINHPGMGYPRVICLDARTGKIEAGHYSQSAISGEWHCGAHMIALERLQRRPDCGDWGDEPVTAREIAEAYGDEMARKIDDGIAEWRRYQADYPI